MWFYVKETLMKTICLFFDKVMDKFDSKFVNTSSVISGYILESSDFGIRLFGAPLSGSIRFACNLQLILQLKQKMQQTSFSCISS